MFEKLFTPITIRGLTLKGRGMWSACGTRFTSNRHVTDRHIAYHVARAKGGCPLNMIECTGVHEGSDGYMFLSLAKDEYVPDLKRLTDAVHEVGGKIGIQIYQAGLGTCFDPDVELLMPDTISLETMEDVRQSFGKATRRAIEGGVDLIEVHCAHQYLLHSFLSPAFNHRTDEYGGSLENRAKFPIACIKMVRDNMPDDMPLFIRTSLKDDFVEGLSVEDCIQFCKWAKNVGVDALDLSRGNMSSPANQFEVPPIDLPRGFNLELAERFKKETGMITIGVGRINDPEFAEKALEKVDMVVMSRAQMVDPEFMNKCREGRVQDIVRCIGCNEGCLDGFADLSMPHISCTRNPQLGREAEMPILPAKEPRTVLIAGGGPAGMMAAKILKEEGHTPILCEASNKLGGAFLLAGSIEREAEMKIATEESGEQLFRQGVDIRLNTTVTPELIKEIHPDAVFCCIGAEPITLPFAAGKKNVFTAQDVLTGEAKVSGNVIVIGGHGTGIEAAEFVALADRGNKVTILERETAYATDMGSARRYALNRILPEEGIEIVVNANVSDITDGKVLADVNGEAKEFPCDYIIMAVGVRSRDCSELKSICHELGIGFEVLGDAKKALRAFEAYNDGFEAAIRMNDPDYIKKISQ